LPGRDGRGGGDWVRGGEHRAFLDWADSGRGG
jgi:hypothetical protein